MQYIWALLAFPIIQLSSLPQNPTVVTGIASFDTLGQELTVHADDRAIINWNSFSIDASESVEFIQPSTSAVVLNRVTGNDPSSILGQLTSNGQIVLINQHGILFDSTSAINTGSLIASCFDILDDPFHDAAHLIFRGNAQGSINFLGQMDIAGDFYAICDSISHEGALRVVEGDAGFFALGNLSLGELEPVPIFHRTACQGLELTINAHTHLDDDSQFFSQSGGLSFLSTVSTTASMTTQNAIFAAGTVIYLNETAQLTASRATGGADIYLGGVETGNPQIFDRSSIVIAGPGATINASADINGNGGKIILWSQRDTEFYNDLSAMGGENSGNGGFIEVSSLGNLGIYGTASTDAPAGIPGMFLIDPADVVINNVANTNIGAFIPAPPPPVPGQNYSFTGSPATILNTTLQGLLAANNVLINTANGVGGAGSITVLNNVTWASARSLNLTANTSITIRATVENTGGVGVGGDLILNAGTDVVLNAVAAGAAVLAGTRNGTITVTAGGNVQLLAGAVANASATIGTTAAVVNNATFNITAGNNLQLTANNATNAFAAIGSTSASTNTGSMTLIVNNDLIMNSGNSAGAFTVIGASSTSNSTRPISINVNRDLSMTGGGSTNSFATIGSAVNAINAGTINISVNRNATLQGGTGVQGYALIGGFGQTSRAINMNVNQDLTINGGTGGSAVSAPFAAIGSYNNGIAPNGNVGDITVNVGRNLNITGGVTASIVFTPCAGIMRAGEGTGINSFTSQTNFNVNVGNNLTMTGGTIVPNTGATALIGFGGFRIQGAGATTVNVGNINVNVGHNLEMICSAGKGAAHIVGGTQRQCQGDVVIKVGENFYMHDIPSVAGFLGNSIGGSGTFNTSLWRLNFYVTVGKSLTIDSRNNGFNSFHCFNGVGNYINQGIVQFHIGGDLTFIGGNQNQNDTATVWLHPNLINEIWVGGNWRAYNGANCEAGVEPNVLFASGNIGRPDWRAGGNIVVAGAVASAFGPNNNLFTTTQPIFIQADYPFALGQLWPPQSVIVNGSNIFTGTPLAAVSTNTSTVSPFNSGGDGLGGFAVDTNQYNFSVIALPTTINGPSWSTADPNPPAPPSAFGFLVKSYTAGISGPANLTILSSDAFDNGQAADFTIGTSLQTVTLRSSQGDILVQGFRDTNIVDFNSLQATLGTITVDTVRDLFATNSTTTAGTTINLFAGENIDLTNANMLAGVDFFEQAGDNIDLMNSLISAGTGNILSLAGNNSSFTNSSATALNHIDWVIDNDFPTSPLIGPSTFTMDGSSLFDSTLGYLRIYTAIRSQNSISPLAQFILNGVPSFFSPGAIYINSLQEMWCTYYPDGVSGNSFRIFYKDCLQPTQQQIAQQATTIIDESLVDLHPYNEFPGWMERYTISFASPEGDPSDPETLWETKPFYLRRRHLNKINHPKSYTHLNCFLNN